jgi:hypothetical protein
MEPKNNFGCGKQAAMALLGLLAFGFALARCMGEPMTPADYQFLTLVAQLPTEVPTATPTLPPAVALPTLPPPPPPQIPTQVPSPTPLPILPQLGEPPKVDTASQKWPPNPCIPAPQMFDPPNGKTFSAFSTVLRWRSDYELKPDETFSIWGGNEIKTLVQIGKTRDKILPVDFMKWKFAGMFGVFFWEIHIEQLDDTRHSCASQPFSFTLTPKEEPALPGPPAPTRGR